jgi:signal transduction histidine kinase
LLYGLFWGGVGSIGAIVGIFIVLGSLFAARWLGEFELRRIRWAEPRPIRPVSWNGSTASNGSGASNSNAAPNSSTESTNPSSNWFLRTFAALGNPNYWLYLLHGLIALPIVGAFTAIFTLTWLTVILGLLFSAPAYLIWGANAIQVGPSSYLNTHTGIVIFAAITLAVGMTALLPFITRGFVLLHFQVDRLFLGGFRVRELEQQVSDLASSRSAAVSAEGTALRRLERDIHDGPQQRLVRLQMDIAAAERQLDSDPAKARELLSGAMSQSKEALEELRALSRGFAPPLLLDRGLVAALESLVDRGSVATTFVNSIESGTLLPQELERNAYFVASELLTNVAKHANATKVELTLGVRHENGSSWLDLDVTDDGVGGAKEVVGHGIAGLKERVHGLGGTLDLSSPTGGPTVAEAHLPVTLTAAPLPAKTPRKTAK